MNRRKICVKVPASTANLGPGFDALGMAVDLYTWIEMSETRQTKFRLYGDQMQGVPTDKSNLVYEVAQMVFAEAGVSVPELEISMYSDIPLTRGLGSSAAAIVGALVAANALIGGPLSEHKLFQMAAALEKHPDNVGASLFGGIVVAFWDGRRAEYIRLEPGDTLEALAAIPAFQLSTEKARHALPQEYSRADAVFNVGHASLLVAALATGRHEVIRHAMKDALHEPYRAELVPGMRAILDGAVNHGALGVALSGAGPTMLALVDAGSKRKAELERFMRDAFRAEGVSAETMWLKPTREGAVLLTPDSPGRTLIDMIKGEALKNP